MPTFPYKYEEEYTLTKANSRTPNTYGYYCSMKEVPQRSKGETYNGSWQAFAMNDYVFRFTDVMLMRAEALIETDQLMEARDIINDIRQRAKNSIDKHIAYAKDQCDIALYPESYFQNKGDCTQVSALGTPTGVGNGERTLLRPASLGHCFQDAQCLLRQ